jgi:glycosyltransferase involved in cell wall biosynthesis
MKISGYTYVRNGLQFSYPFIEAITSALPIVDEFVVVLGDSTDGSREAILAINSPKIRILDTVWDLNMRVGGKLFAQQSNLGLAAMTGDWVLHLQADEVIHEDDAERLKRYIVEHNNYPMVDGLLFPFLNFRGDYNHIVTGRSRHRFEIRAFRNHPLIRAYKDSQGFRKFSSNEAYEQGEKGTKLNVVKIDVPVYHYSHVRPPRLMQQKAQFFDQFYVNDSELEKRFNDAVEYDYNNVDILSVFSGSHPSVMKSVIDAKDWDFKYDPSKSKSSFRHKLLNKVEALTGWRIGEYKNYKLLPKSALTRKSN